MEFMECMEHIKRLCNTQQNTFMFGRLWSCSTKRKPHSHRLMELEWKCSSKCNPHSNKNMWCVLKSRHKNSYIKHEL